MLVKEITSRDNQYLKRLNKLKLKKYRDELGIFVVENIKTILDGAKSGYQFEQLFVTQEVLDKYPELSEKMTDKQEIFLVPKVLVKSFSSLEESSGVFAIYAKPQEVALTKIQNISPLVYLNGVADPGNLGTILRSAAAFDAKTIITDDNSADFYNQKTVAAAKDAIFKLTLIRSKNGSDDLRELQSNGWKIWSAVLGEKSLPKILPGAKDKICLVVGSEGSGIDREIIALSDKLFSLPMSDKIESLNVAIASSLVLSDFFRSKK